MKNTIFLSSGILMLLLSASLQASTGNFQSQNGSPVLSVQENDPPYLDYVLRQCSIYWQMSMEEITLRYRTGILVISLPDPLTNTVTCTMDGGVLVVIVADSY